MNIKLINSIEYTTAGDVASYIGVSLQTVHNYIKEGKISALKISCRKIYIPVSDVMKLVK